MPARYLIDTDICIYLRKNDCPAITERFAALDRNEAAVSVITFGELAHGAARSNDPARAAQGIEWLTHVVQILRLPTNAARIYGAIRARLSVPAA
jgi:tRNA(fMet)-specific endonuclease VapC